MKGGQEMKKLKCFCCDKEITSGYEIDCEIVCEECNKKLNNGSLFAYCENCKQKKLFIRKSKKAVISICLANASYCGGTKTEIDYRFNIGLMFIESKQSRLLPIIACPKCSIGHQEQKSIQ